MELEGMVCCLITALIYFTFAATRLHVCFRFQFSWFNSEVLQKMETNVRLDRNYLSVSENHTHLMELFSLIDHVWFNHHLVWWLELSMCESDLSTV